jgi:hypothetical protein
MGVRDITAKSDSEIETWIENHERRGATDTGLYHELLEERARRQSKLLNIEKSLAHLMEAARRGSFVTYGSLAEANGVPWNKARHAMNGAGGHLDLLLDICHARGLPLFTAICVNQQAVLTGELEPHSLQGFTKGAQRLGYRVTDPLLFLKERQRECFDCDNLKPAK